MPTVPAPKLHPILWLLGSVLAVVVGILVSAMPAVAMDSYLGAFDSKNGPWSDSMFAIATGYRAVFAIAGG